ncbi:MAG: SMP-30/gluconolactonase/LRE family protein [Anaerolineae bacterium]|nr:SMP-30/gluconolactonase/LRE family protein [Anaerolineae bacterium]
MYRILLVLLVALLVAVGAVFAQDDMMLPDVIEIEQPGIIPEGIEWDEEGGRFLVGSVTQGTIFQFDDMGAISPFIEDEDLVSSIGIHIDRTSGRLLVANTDANIAFNPGEANPFAGLAAYDLATGERLFLVDMTDLYESPAHFANDVVTDADGNAYVTNSMAPVIYKVTPEGEASVFVENEAFAVEGFGLNGIEFHPDGYLLAAVGASSSIYKIPLDDPDSLTLVATDMPYSIDGMAFDPNYDLVAVAAVEAGQILVMLSSDDDWATAYEQSHVETDGNATTVAIRDGSAFYTKGYFGNPAQEVYDINQVTLMTLMGMGDNGM